MIKICSLEFLNRDYFDAEILLEDGTIIVPMGAKVTPDILLRLYFKNLFVEKELVDIMGPEAAIIEPRATLTEEISEEALVVDLKFDTAEAQRVSDYASFIGKLLELPEDKIAELEQAAYYHKIGVSKLNSNDLLDKKFVKMRAEEGYKIILNEMKLPEIIANVARTYYRKYDITQFKVRQDEKLDMPYAHIVSIASRYDELLSKKHNKKESLEKMLQLGGNKFNVFILHKFIKAMKEIND